jgi:hypothetical protein
MATAVAPRPLADDVEQALITLDADFATIYGPDMGHWSRGVLGEFLETQRSRRTADREVHPLHPRRASASRRRRHTKQLPWRIGQIAPGAVTILITPLWTDTTGTSTRHVVARALTADGRVIKFQAGGSRQIATLLQGAHPAANWDHPQTWRADTNTLVDRVTRKAAS